LFWFLFCVRTAPSRLPTMRSFLTMLSAKSVGDRAKQLNVVLRREITKIGSFEAEQAQAHKTTIFSEVSMTDFKPSMGSQYLIA